MAEPVVQKQTSTESAVQAQRSATPESASEPELEPEVQHELSTEEQAQARADVGVTSFFVFIADDPKDACEATGSTREALRGQAEEVCSCDKCNFAGQEEAVGTGTGEQRECRVQEYGCASRISFVELRCREGVRRQTTKLPRTGETRRVGQKNTTINEPGNLRDINVNAL
jgi:hypothetical protein